MGLIVTGDESVDAPGCWLWAAPAVAAAGDVARDDAAPGLRLVAAPGAAPAAAGDVAAFVDVAA